DQHYSEQVVEEEEEEEIDRETVTFAAFDTLDQTKSCLMIGYQDGFQVWDITSPDNVHEICSIRDKETLGAVSCIHLLRHVQNTLAIVTEKNKKSRVFIYSLKTYSIIKEITSSLNTQVHEDEPVLVTCIESNPKIIALGCLSHHKSSIQLLNMDYKPLSSPLIDVYHTNNTGPIFTLGSRLIAYATSTAVLNKDTVMTSFSNKLQVDNDVKGAAKDIAKEVVSGMKSLEKITPSGMVMIRDLQKLPNKGMGNSWMAHFRPHTHPISCLTFNPSGTLLMSASKQGHTFHIFTIMTHPQHQNPSHLYSLSRGYTDAQVEDCQFSNDSNWCAISTARGTTHVYAINPYGGKPELAGHIHNKINNNLSRYSFINNKPKTTVTALGPILRIKQRKQIKEDAYINSMGLPISRLQRDPRAKLTSSFVSRLVMNQEELYENYNKQSMLRPLIHQSSDLMFGFDEDYEDLAKTHGDMGSQALYTFHPSGLLTLYRCWVTKSVKDREMLMKKESVAEWKVARHSDWNQVQHKLEPTKKVKKKKQNLLWLSNAEITTYAQEFPIWSRSQFVFQTYQKCLAGEMPVTETLVMPKEMPEPVSSRMNRVRKTRQGAIEENMEDAWLSTSANTFGKSFMNRNTSVSFEDAYLINMGGITEPLIQLDEDVVRFESDPQLQNNLYLPDGDNEAAYPFESIFEGFQMNDDEQEAFPQWH
ncbi:Breast carcinoma amplified sequence 3, partial [Rhizopus stolonifer]